MGESGVAGESDTSCGRRCGRIRQVAVVGEFAMPPSAVAGEFARPPSRASAPLLRATPRREGRDNRLRELRERRDSSHASASFARATSVATLAARALRLRLRERRDSARPRERRCAKAPCWRSFCCVRWGKGEKIECGLPAPSPRGHQARADDACTLGFGEPSA